MIRESMAVMVFMQSLVDMNQGLLAGLGVSHPSLEKVIQLTAAHGLHTKLTGAGGGGVAFSLLTPGIGGDKVGGHNCYCG